MMSKYQSMTKMLRKKKWITLREGRCQKTINEKGKVVYKQKGVDALIILDMYDIKENFPNVSKIVLIASDSDFVPVISRMKQKGIRCFLPHKQKCMQRLTHHFLHKVESSGYDHMFSI